MTDETTPSESLLKFPCDFTIKVFGQATDAFEIAVLSIVRKHVPDFSDSMLKSRLSENGKYNALSIVVHVKSRAQLDQIYQDLSSNPEVMMAL